MADFDFLEGFDADGDWGFTSVKTKPATESKADSDATKEVVKATADGVGTVSYTHLTLPTTPYV